MLLVKHTVLLDACICTDACATITRVHWIVPVMTLIIREIVSPPNEEQYSLLKSFTLLLILLKEFCVVMGECSHSPLKKGKHYVALFALSCYYLMESIIIQCAGHHWLRSSSNVC